MELQIYVINVLSSSEYSVTEMQNTGILMIRVILIQIFVFIIFLNPAYGNSPHRFIIGGPVRLGSFDLNDVAYKDMETELYYDQNKIVNALGSSLFLNYEYDRFGVGIRWMKYSLEGENSELDQKLDLDYRFLTVSISIIENIPLHPKVESTLGLAFGTGQNYYSLSTKTNEALSVTTIDKSYTSSGKAVLKELFLRFVQKIGWGYKLGYFVIDTEHPDRSDSRAISGSTETIFYQTLVWQY